MINDEYLAGALLCELRGGSAAGIMYAGSTTENDMLTDVRPLNKIDRFLDGRRQTNLDQIISLTSLC